MDSTALTTNGGGAHHSSTRLTSFAYYAGQTKGGLGLIELEILHERKILHEQKNLKSKNFSYSLIAPSIFVVLRNRSYKNWS